MQTILKRHQNLDWYMIGSWNPTAGASVTLETVSGRDFTKGEILLFTPFAHNRFQSSIFCPKYSIATYEQKVRLSWMWDGSYRYVDIEKVDNTHFKLTGSDNLPNDCQVLCFAFAYYGAY